MDFSLMNAFIKATMVNHEFEKNIPLRGTQLRV